MIVVSDASPLNYLIIIDLQELLPRLFGKVVVPPIILKELGHERAPQSVRDWAGRPPAWVQVRPATRLIDGLRLDAGEAEAISLSNELGADLLLIDERQGVAVAKRLGLHVIGVLGILELAAERGWVSLPAALDDLRKTTCRLSSTIVADALARDRARRQPRSLS